MRACNLFTLRGRVARDIELRTTVKDVPYCYITLAVEGPYRKDAERVADFVPLIAYRHTAEFAAKNLTKGTMIAVVGEIRAKNDKDDNGDWHEHISFIAEQVEFAGPKSSGDGASGQETQPQTADDGDNDLPF